MTTNIVVLLPGTSGSTLVGPIPGVSVWPLGVAATALGDPQLAATLLEGTLFPGQVMLTEYGTLINSFTAAGYQNVNAVWPRQRQPPAPAATAWSIPPALQQNVLVNFPYDWRQDNSITAKWLQSLLGSLYLAAKKDCGITLLGHSMGGLVARGYLEVIGKNDPWYGSIRRLITLGTPHFGAPLALDAMVNDVAAIFESLQLPDRPNMDIVIWEFVNSNFNSTYELLPPPGNTFISDDGTATSIFPFSGLTPDFQSFLTGNSYSTNNATAATTFLNTLSYAGAPNYFCIYGTGSQTATAFTFSGGALTATSGDGDQIVPATSASFAGKLPTANTAGFANATHLGMPSDPRVIAQVQRWLAS